MRTGQLGRQQRRTIRGDAVRALQGVDEKSMISATVMIARRGRLTAAMIVPFSLTAGLSGPFHDSLTIAVQTQHRATVQAQQRDLRKSDDQPDTRFHPPTNIAVLRMASSVSRMDALLGLDWE